MAMNPFAAYPLKLISPPMADVCQGKRVSCHIIVWEFVADTEVKMDFRTRALAKASARIMALERGAFLVPSMPFWKALKQARQELTS